MNVPAIAEVSPVRLHHVPNWFRLRMLRTFGTRDGLTGGPYVLEHAIASATEWVNRLAEYAGEPSPYHPHWLDHWGSAKIDGEVCFVAEPYMEFPPMRDSLAVPHHLACSTNCRLVVLRESAWNPPGTIRILFKPNRGPA